MAGDTPEGTRVEVEAGEWRGFVTLAESVPGAGDWSVLGVEVSALNGSALSAARLRAAPWGELLETARAQVEGMSKLSRIVSPSELYLSAFTVDRRGKSARTERDYAELALAYLMFGQERGHKAAGHWSQKHGRSAQRWRMDIKRAKHYLVAGSEEGTLGLSAEALLLIYGNRLLDQLHIEGEVDIAEAQLKRLENLGDGSAESAALQVQIDRLARQWARENHTTAREASKAILKQARARRAKSVAEWLHASG